MTQLRHRSIDAAPVLDRLARARHSKKGDVVLESTAWAHALFDRPAPQNIGSRTSRPGTLGLAEGLPRVRLEVSRRSARQAHDRTTLVAANGHIRGKFACASAVLWGATRRGSFCAGACASFRWMVVVERRPALRWWCAVPRLTAAGRQQKLFHSRALLLRALVPESSCSLLQLVSALC